MSFASEPTVSLIIDGLTLRVPAGQLLLQAAREAGVEIPTLCQHPDLQPVGACRLCLVEVSHPGREGDSELKAACLHPVAEGIEVRTRSEEVQGIRRRLLEELLTRCPESATVRRLAREHGVDPGGQEPDPAADGCIFCELCSRVCQAHATSALVTRGVERSLSTFIDASPEACVGCGACAQLCPTGVIAARRSAEDYQIWGRSFATALAVVHEQRCVGCGACEEACPFDVPRVALRRGGRQVAQIPAAQCRGCGACVGACPTGAIEQQGNGWEALTALISGAVEGGDA